MADEAEKISPAELEKIFGSEDYEYLMACKESGDFAGFCHRLKEITDAAGGLEEFKAMAAALLEGREA